MWVGAEGVEPPFAQRPLGYSQSGTPVFRTPVIVMLWPETSKAASGTPWAAYQDPCMDMVDPPLDGVLQKVVIVTVASEELNAPTRRRLGRLNALGGCLFLGTHD